MRLTLYLTDLANFPQANEIMQEYFKAPYPARSTVGVASLPRGAAVRDRSDRRARVTRWTRSTSGFTKLGLRSGDDLLLHLPLRYEDETRLTPIARLADGMTAQVQGEVVDSESSRRGRRSLVVRLRDDSGELTLRFLNFYPSQVAQLARRAAGQGAWRGEGGPVRLRDGPSALSAGVARHAAAAIG